MAYYPGTCVFLPWFDWTKAGEIPIKTVRKFDQFSTFRYEKQYPENEGEKVRKLLAADHRVFGTLSANDPTDWGMPDDEFRALIQTYLDNVPTRVVEIGNEPGQVVIEPYFKKLKIAAEMIHADGRRALMGAPYPDATFKYLDGANLRDAYDWVDGVCVHIYRNTPKASLDYAKQIRARLDGHGCAKPIHITEFGWATKGQEGHNLVVSEKVQAEYLTQIFKLWKSNAHDLNLANCLWYMYNDWSPEKDQPPPMRWPHWCGVVRLDGSRKPSYAALKAAGV